MTNRLLRLRTAAVRRLGISYPFELPRPAEVHPLDDVEIAPGIYAHGVRCGEKGGIGFVVLFVRFAVRLLAVTKMRDQLVMASRMVTCPPKSGI